MDPTLQLVINVGAAATALAAVIGLPIALVKLWPLIKRGVAILESAEKLPEMADEITAQSASLEHLKAEVLTVKQQVQNSHVTNLRDDVDEVIGKLDGFHDKLDDHLKTCPPPPTTTINVNGIAP